MKAVSASATMSKLVRSLLESGCRPVLLKDGRIKIGSHFFRRGKRADVVR